MPLAARWHRPGGYRIRLNSGRCILFLSDRRTAVCCFSAACTKYAQFPAALMLCPLHLRKEEAGAPGSRNVQKTAGGQMRRKRNKNNGNRVYWARVNGSCSLIPPVIDDAVLDRKCRLAMKRLAFHFSGGAGNTAGQAFSYFLPDLVCVLRFSRRSFRMRATRFSMTFMVMACASFSVPSKWLPALTMPREVT